MSYIAWNDSFRGGACLGRRPVKGLRRRELRRGGSGILDVRGEVEFIEGYRRRRTKLKGWRRGLREWLLSAERVGLAGVWMEGCHMDRHARCEETGSSLVIARFLRLPHRSSLEYFLNISYLSWRFPASGSNLESGQSTHKMRSSLISLQEHF